MPEIGSSLLVGSLGSDTAILPASNYYWNESGWQRRDVGDTLRWYVFDRQMYRPSEEVHVKGWMRLIGGTQEGDVGLPETDGVSVQYTLVDSRGNEVLDGVAEVNDLAGFDMAFTLPDNMNLGYTYLQLIAQGLPDVWGGPSGVGGQPRYPNPEDNWNVQYQHSFQIQEFRRPEFEVSVGNERGARSSWATRRRCRQSRPTSPAGRSPMPRPTGRSTPRRATTRRPTGRTSSLASGRHGGPTGIGDDGDGGSPRPLRATPMQPAPTIWPWISSKRGTAALQRVRRRRCDGRQSPGLERRHHAAGASGDALRRSAQRAHLRGTGRAAGDRRHRAGCGRQRHRRGNPSTCRRRAWSGRPRGRVDEEEVDVQECAVQSTLEAVHCTFTTDIGGEYRITPPCGRSGPRQSHQFTRWVSGGERRRRVTWSRRRSS